MKPHYPVLDGLRGIAALVVIIYHLFEVCFSVPADHPMHHGYIAVDFFYLLSGFVIGYAYDDRWGRMTIIDFFKIRLIRLHPLVILGVVIGAIGFWFDPYTDRASQVGLLKLIGAMLISFTLFPSPDIRGWGETHSLDGPCWSLFQEYFANVIYAIFGRQITKMILWMIVTVSGIALVIVAVRHGNLATGSGYSSFKIAVIRMMYSFFAGLLLYRTGKLIRVPHAYIVCSLMLMIVFFLPTTKYNGFYEAGCVIIVFPVVVSMGAGATIQGRWLRLCRFSAAISYPIYILHYPFIYIYAAWVRVKNPGSSEIVMVGCGLFVFFILLAWCALKFYDEPVREWLKRKLHPAG